MDHPEDKKFSLKTVKLTYVLTYLGAVGLTLMTFVSGSNLSVGKIFTMFIMMSLCFPVGLGYYVEHIEFFEALGGKSVLIFFYLIYITLFILALCFRGKKVFIAILIIWIALLILNIHGCAEGFADM